MGHFGEHLFGGDMMACLKQTTSVNLLNKTTVLRAAKPDTSIVRKEHMWFCNIFEMFEYQSWEAVGMLCLVPMASHD